MTDAHRPRFVDSLPAALIAIGLTGLACYSTIKAAFQPRPLHGSILLLQLPGVSPAAVIGINILLETVFIAIIVGVALSVRSWERVLVCFYSALLFLTQLIYLLPNVITAIRWAKISCALISLAAALALLVHFEKSKRLNRRVPEPTDS